MPDPDVKPFSSTGIGPAAAAGIVASLFEDEADAEGMPRVPGFRMARLLGRGGGGAVYLAYRPGSESRLAVKLVPLSGVHSRPVPTPKDPGQAGRSAFPVSEATAIAPVSSPVPELPAASRRAWRELDLLQQLRLPALPRMIDYGVHEGRLYIATEFVDGLPLDRHCDEAIESGSGRMGLDRRARVKLLAEVADAVHSLHEHGVIHRDIKPSNILIDSHGRPVIIDLGIATLLAQDVMDTLTADGAPIGSPAFMAPEQARGERDRISTRADVYGLGATAYLILTGKTPHDTDATLHEVVRRVAQEPARPARELEPTLPKPLAAVLEKAVSPRPEGRYASAGEFSCDLRRWLAGEQVIAVEAGRLGRAMRWLARHPVVATAAAACLIVLCVLSVSVAAVWWIGLQPESIVRGTTVDNRAWAAVRSRAGLDLRRWEGPLDSIPVVTSLIRDRTQGGGKLFLVAPLAPTRDPLADQLCAFSPRDLNKPAWSSGTGPPQIEMPLLDGFSAPQTFVCKYARLADVFPEPSGPEIVALFCHSRWGPCALRIYDQRGSVLYEVWNDGWIRDVAWLPEPGLLVLGGVNSYVSWLGRGAVVKQNPFPGVVFAIRPELDQRPGWICTPTEPGDVNPVWYKCLLPADALDRLAPNGGDILGVMDRTPSTFVVNLSHLSLVIDATGCQVRKPVVETKYNLSGDMPDPETYFFLGDLPAHDPTQVAQARPRNDY